MSMKRMNLEEVKEEVRDLLIESLELDGEQTHIVGDDLINELGINSVDALEIFVRVENKFNFFFPDEDLNSELLSTLDGFAEYIIRRCE